MGEANKINQLINYYNNSLLSRPFFGPGSAIFESCDLGESLLFSGLDEGEGLLPGHQH